jgi:hypothetical protein
MRPASAGAIYIYRRFGMQLKWSSDGEAADHRAARRALFTVSAIPSVGGRPTRAKEPNQEPTQADSKRHLATPGDC